MPPGNGLTIRPLAGLVQYLQQLYQAPPNTIRNIDPTEYGSPLQPMLPIAPEGTEPRGFQWWWGQNLNFVPRPDAEYSAADLKLMATYPLARICIENAKDQICKAAWEIRLKPEEGESRKQLAQRSKGDPNLRKLNELFEYPDRFNNWTDWVRPLIDDMLVIDAAAILLRKTFKGQIAELQVLRGESITRLIDRNGWTPQPPDPAYQQNWWGLPLVDLTADQLVYKPRNIVPRNTVSSQLYGMSPTEQLADEIKIGMKRLEFILNYYTEGSIPGLVHIVPKGTSPEKISEAMLWMNSELAGNLAARQQWRMIPGFNEPGKPDQILETKKELLSDPFDELHIRKICFGYGTSPQRLMRMMGTRNAEAQQEAAQEEGILPWIDWLKGVIDYIIQRKIGLDDYEITFTPFKDPDPEKEANIAKILVAGTIMTPNEGRGRVGLDPWDPGQAKGDNEADMLGTVGASGFTPITGAGALSTPKPEPPKVLPGGGPGGTSIPNKKQPGGGKGGPATKVNGTNGTGFSKAHCSDHDEYDEDCIACAENEIRRLQAKVAPASAVAANRTTKAVPRGEIGFAGGSATVLEPPQYAELESYDGGATLVIKQEHKFGSTQVEFTLPEFFDLQAKINDSDLMSHGKVPDPHITICWGLLNPDEDLEKLKYQLKDVRQFSISFGKTKKFTPGEHSEGACPLYVAVVDGKEALKKLNILIRDTADVKESDHGSYIPHLTIAYIDPEKVDNYVGMDELLGVVAHVTAIVVTGADDTQRTIIPLKGQPLKKDDDEGEWITINGAHVHISPEGHIDKGPDEMIGRKQDELKGSENEWKGEARAVFLKAKQSDDYWTQKQGEAGIRYLDGEKPLAEYSDGKYRCAIIEDHSPNEPGHEYDPASHGIELTFKEGEPRPVPTGRWMDWYEQHWQKDYGISEQQYRQLPVEQRASLEAKEQVKVWVKDEYSNNFKKWYGRAPSAQKVTKRSHLIGKKILAGKLQPSSIDAMNRMHRVLTSLLQKMEKKVLTKVKSYANLPDRIPKVKLKKAEGDFDIDELLRILLADLAVDWATLPSDLQDDLREAALRGVSEGLAQIDVTDENVIQQVNTVARDWAEQRAAEMVGMRRLDDGTLIENPNAKWVISDSTRDDLRRIMIDVFSEESPTMESLTARIQQAGTFSDSRAKMIAKTETISSEVLGNLEAWVGSGVVTKVDWLLSNDHDIDDECDEAADGGPYMIDDVPDYPAHPNCECVLVVAGVEGEEGAE